MTATPQQQAAELYAAGLSLREVGHAIGVTYATVHTWLRDAGVELRPRNPPARVRVTALVPPEHAERLQAQGNVSATVARYVAEGLEREGR